MILRIFWWFRFARRAAILNTHGLSAFTLGIIVADSARMGLLAVLAEFCRHRVLLLKLGDSSFVPKRFDKVRDIVEPDLAQIHVPFNYVKNRSPDRHFARAMRCHRLFLPGDNRLDAVARKLAAVSVRQQREIGRRMPERGGGRAVAFAVRPVTSRAVVAEDLRAFERKRNAPTRIPGRRLAAPWFPPRPAFG